MIYENELGGADEAALQEAGLRARAERDPAFYGEPAPPLSGEASFAAKSTASGGVRDLRFFDLDTCFWQLARQASLQHNLSDSSALPHFGERAPRPAPILVRLEGQQGPGMLPRAA